MLTMLTMLTVLTQKRVPCGEHSVQRKARFIAPLSLLAVPRSKTGEAFQRENDPRKGRTWCSRTQQH